MKNYEKNIFTKIISGEIPCKKVFEDEYCFAFHDINPKAQVHILIVPKMNVVDFSDFIQKNEKNNEFIANFFKSVNKIANDILKLDNFQIISNNGRNAGQEVFHFHIHIKSNKK